MNEMNSRVGPYMMVILAFLGAFCQGSAALAGESQPVCMMDALTGRVRLRVRADPWRKAGLMRLVLAGTEIQVPAGGSAEAVFFQDGHKERLTGPAGAVVESRGLRLTSGAPSARSTIPAPRQTVALSTAAVTLGDQIGGTGLRGDPWAILNGNLWETAFSQDVSVAETSVRLTWDPVPGAAGYRIVLENAQGDPQFPKWETVSSDPGFSYPSGAAPLAPGADYDLTTTPLQADGTALDKFSGVRELHVLSGQELASVRESASAFSAAVAADPSGTGPYAVMAAEYMGLGLWGQAKPVVAHLVHARPSDWNLHRMLALVCLHLGEVGQCRQERTLGRRLEAAP